MPPSLDGLLPGLVIPPGPALDCDDARIVHRMPPGTIGRFARFSPDGRTIALQLGTTAGEPGGIDLVSMDTCTGAMTAVVEDVVPQTAPVFSPDGKFLFYTFGRTEADSSIRMVRAEGGNVSTVLSEFGAMMPDISPNGGTMVYAINGGSFRLFELGQENEPNELPFGGYSPRFAPDGQRLAYAEPMGGEMHIRVHDLASRNTEHIAVADVTTSYLATVDFLGNRGLVFTSDVGTEAILADGERVPLDSANGWVDVSTDGRLIAILDGNQLVVLQDAI
jgi:Tol biopolymer transport system component